jgi:Protein of unknown function (DUF732)
MNILRVGVALPLIAVGIWVGIPVSHAGPVGDTSPVFSGTSGDESGSAFTIDVADVMNGTVTKQTPAKATGLAEAICSKLRSGVDESDLAIALAAPPDPVPVHSAQFVIHAAEWHFCPAYYRY